MVENRSWKHKAPFWFLLHASKSPARKKDLVKEAKHTPQLYDWRLTSPRGEIVALVHVASIRRMSEKDFYKPFCSGPLIWELDRVLPLTTPVPIKGALQLCHCVGWSLITHYCCLFKMACIGRTVDPLHGTVTAHAHRVGHLLPSR